MKNIDSLEDLQRKKDFQEYVDYINEHEKNLRKNSLEGLGESLISDISLPEYSSTDKRYDREFSREAFFGKDNPLANSLDNGVIKLKELLRSPDDNKEEIIKHIRSWGNEVGEIINCESFHFCLGYSKGRSESFASVYVGLDDAIELDKFTGEVTIDKIKYEQQHKMIETKNGYRFKDPKGKHMAVMISPYLFEAHAENGSEERANNPRAVSAVLCHEIGHAMQHCVLGALNDAYSHALRSYFDKQFTEDDRDKPVFLDKDTGDISVGAKKILNTIPMSYIDEMVKESYKIVDGNKFKKISDKEKEDIQKITDDYNQRLKQSGKTAAIFSKLLQTLHALPKSDLQKYREKGLPLEEHPAIKACLANKTIADSQDFLEYSKNDKYSEDTVEYYKHQAGYRKSERFEKSDISSTGQSTFNSYGHFKDKNGNDVKYEIKEIQPSEAIEIKKSFGVKVSDAITNISSSAKNVLKYFWYAVKEASRKLVIDVVLNTLKNTALILTGTYIRRELTRKREHWNEEAFADIFASAHGYDNIPDTLKDARAVNTTTGLGNFDYTGEFKKKHGYSKHKFDWMYNMPILSLLTYFNEYCFDVSGERTNPGWTYNTFTQRINRSYLHLKHELERCKDPKLKEEIKQSMIKIKKNYDDLYNDKYNIRCRSYQLYDKILGKIVFGKIKGPFAARDSKDVKKDVIDAYDKLEKVDEEIQMKKKSIESYSKNTMSLEEHFSSLKKFSLESEPKGLKKKMVSELVKKKLNDEPEGKRMVINLGLHNDRNINPAFDENGKYLGHYPSGKVPGECKPIMIKGIKTEDQYYDNYEHFQQEAENIAKKLPDKAFE